MNYSSKDRWGRIAIKLHEDVDLCSKCRVSCKAAVAKGAYDKFKQRRQKKTAQKEEPNGPETNEEKG